MPLASTTIDYDAVIKYNMRYRTVINEKPLGVFHLQRVDSKDSSHGVGQLFLLVLGSSFKKTVMHILMYINISYTDYELTINKN